MTIGKGLSAIALVGLAAIDVSAATISSPVIVPVLPATMPGAICSPSFAIPNSGTVYYVSPTGKNTNNGLTPETAFATIRYPFGNAFFHSGDTVVVMPGTYQQWAAINTPGKPGACTTLMGMPGAAKPVITYSGTDHDTVGVLQPYVRVSGLAVTHPNAAGAAIGISGHTMVDSGGVLRPTIHHIQIDNNVAYMAGGAGIVSSSNDYVYIYGNVAYGNCNIGPKETSGIDLYEFLNADENAGYHNKILNNITYRNKNLVFVPGTSHTTDGNGIIIDDNRRTQSDNIAYRGRTLILGNVSFSNGGRGIVVYSSAHVDIYNNTAYGNLLDSYMQSYPYNVGDIQSGASGDVRVWNNIAAARAGSLAALYEYGAPADIASNQWLNNLVYTGLVNIPAILPASNLIGVNPLFATPSADPAVANFALQSGSPAIGAGKPLTISVVDIGGKATTTGGALNIGAYTQQ